MTVTSIGNRVAKLEAAATPAAGDTRRVVVMCRDADEPVAAAIARWCAAHPGEPAPSENDPNVLILMSVIHDPPQAGQ